MEFKTRRELWDKKEELKSRIDGIFEIIQNPIIPTDEDFERADKAVTEFETYLETTVCQIGEYLKSEECKEEAKEFQKLFKYNLCGRSEE